jgi:hypothetical protein
MALQPIPQTTPPPVVPNRSDRANFAIQTQNWTLWQKNYNYPETLLVLASVQGNALHAQERATAAGEYAATAQSAANAAETSAQTAAGISGASPWVAGNYAFGTFVWSPLSLLTYRRRPAGVTASAVDPSLDPAGWKLAGSVMSMPQADLTTAGPHQLVVGFHYIVKHPDAVCLMPAGAAPQEQVRVTNKSGNTRVKLLRNGSTFDGWDDDIVLDSRTNDKTYTKTAGNTWL